MKYFELTKDEQELLDEFERGEWKSIPNLEKAKKLYQNYARNTLNKKKNINIRLSERDLYKLKAKAIQEGLPYQTYAASVLHKAASQ